MGVELGVTQHMGRTALWIHSLEVAHIEGFLIHEFDVEETQFCNKPVTRFEECGQQDIVSPHHKTHAHMRGRILHLDSGAHAVNVGQFSSCSASNQGITVANQQKGIKVLLLSSGGGTMLYHHEERLHTICEVIQVVASKAHPHKLLG